MKDVQRIRLRDGVDTCPSCGKLLIFELMQKVRSAESENVCSCCGRSIWWLEWYVMRKREAK